MKAAQTQHPEWYDVFQSPAARDRQILYRIQSDQTITMIRKLAIDYVNFIKECWVHASVSPLTDTLVNKLKDRSLP